jgi:hypothetical protein
MSRLTWVSDAVTLEYEGGESYAKKINISKKSEYKNV